VVRFDRKAFGVVRTDMKVRLDRGVGKAEEAEVNEGAKVDQEAGVSEKVA
jgi:hypothetical protein